MATIITAIVSGRKNTTEPVEMSETIEFGAFELSGLSGVSIAKGGDVLGIRMAFPSMSMGLFDEKDLIMNLERPDSYAPDLSYVRYSWHVPVSKDAVRRFAKTPISGNSPTAFIYKEGEAARVAIEWQVVDGRAVHGRYTSDILIRAALFVNGCHKPAEIVAASLNESNIRQGDKELFVRLHGDLSESILADSRKQAESALIWPNFSLNGKSMSIHPLMLGPECPLHFTMAIEEPADWPDVTKINAMLAAASGRYENTRMRSSGAASGAAEAVAALSGYGRTYDPKRKRIQTSVNRTWGGPNTPGLVFGWDNFFTSHIPVWENPRLAAESLAHVVEVYGENGIARGPTQRNLIIPIIYCRILKILGDDALARRTWPVMMDFMRFWFADRGDGIAWRDGNGDGLIEPGSSLDPSDDIPGVIISNAMDETGYDETPMYSNGFTNGRRGLLADNVGFDWKSKCLTISLVCQNSLYVASCKKMSIIAAELGDTGSESWLKAEAERVSLIIKEKLFDSHSGLFLNRLWDGSFSPVKTFTIFFPLLAGLADDDIKHRLKQSLLDPDQFWGGNFIPSVSKDDPSYLDSLDNGGNYWRGNCWPPVTYMCWLSAREAGWYDISAMIAEKVNSQFMKYWLKFGHSYENYPAEGNVDHSFIYPGGPWGGREIRYQWAALLPLCILEEIFAPETVGDGFRFGNPYLSNESEWNGFLCNGQKVSATAGPDITKIEFGMEWSFCAKPGIVVRNFSITNNRVSFNTPEISGDFEINIKMPCFKSSSFEVIVNRHPVDFKHNENGEFLICLKL